MMNSNQLRELAERLQPMAAAPGFDGLDIPAFCAWLRQCAEQRLVAWRDHVEQRLHSWRQRFVNKSGDQLALDDFLDGQSLDDLIDYVCDEWAGPDAAPQPASGEQPEPSAAQIAAAALVMCHNGIYYPDAERIAPAVLRAAAAAAKEQK